MKKKFCVLFALIFIVLGNVRAQLPMRIDSSCESVAYWTKWNTDLYEMGVTGKKDSFFVREEVVRLLKDSAYRQVVYPASYQWPATVKLLEKMELKKACWYLINLYQEDIPNRKTILGALALYDSLLDMDKVILSTFYTYAFPDPRVCRIINGKPDIYRPDLLEKGLQATKEISNYIWAYRRSKKMFSN